MKLGDVIRKERERCGISVVQAAETLKLDVEDYARIENGQSAAEQWGPIIATMAMKLEVPMARLLSVNGRSDGVDRSSVGHLLAQHRRAAGISSDAFARQLGMDVGEYTGVEEGAVPLDPLARWLLTFSELVDQPVFNLFFPCGLPMERIDDYP